MSMLCTSNDVYRELTEPMREVYCLSALLRRISSWHVHLLRPRPRIDFWYRPTLGRRTDLFLSWGYAKTRGTRFALTPG